MNSMNDTQNQQGTLLKEQILKKDASAWTHNGKFHADDVFSAALLLYLNPEIRIFRGNQVPEDFTGVVFDIGRGRYDHHQKDSRIRENGIPYAAFGLLWEGLGADILGEELAEKFDESFVQPLDNNDNTGEKNELASLIGSFNPAWDSEDNNDEAFFQAVSVAGMILDHKFERYLGNERADQRVNELLKAKEEQSLENTEDSRILVLPEFVPCQKRLSETQIAFVIFPSNRGGYCIQPQKKEYSMNYKCSFPSEWLGLEGEELVQATGFESASFCHKGGFLMTERSTGGCIGGLQDQSSEIQRRTSNRKSWREQRNRFTFTQTSTYEDCKNLPSGISEPSRSRNGWHLWRSGHGQTRMESKHKRPDQKNL